MSDFNNISVNGYFFAVAFLFAASGHFKEFVLIYLAAILHETAHFAVMKAKKIKIKNFRIMPYGLIIKSEMIKNSKEEILVSVMGPAANFFAFLICIGFEKLKLFALCNFTLFVLNLAPALPLDGAVVIKAYLARKRGYINAFNTVLTITKITAVIIIFFGMIFLIITKYNISLLIIGMFLLYNIKYEKQNIILMRKELLCGNLSKSVKSFKIRHIGVAKDVKLIGLLSCVSDSYVLCVSVFDNNFKIIGTLSQFQIIDGILKYGTFLSADMLLREEKTNEKQAEKNSSDSGKADSVYRQ